MTRKTESAPLEKLKSYLPPDTFSFVVPYLQKYRVNLTITRSRKSVLGDYRRPYKGKGHRITVNGDLNHYAFLLTLLHELAHMLAFESYGNRIAPHGKEWKQTFKKIMDRLDAPGLFPEDITEAIRNYMHNPAARSCTDDHLVRTLRKYDKVKEGVCLLEELDEGELFMVQGGEQFKKGRKLRKRFECRSQKSGALYIFSPLYEVKRIYKPGR